MKKIFVFVFLLFSTFAFSQLSLGKSASENKWKLGGSIGLGVGANNYFGFNISPFLGYALTPAIDAGLTTGYQYSKRRDSKQNVFSAGPYLQAYPINFLFLRAHYEYFNGSYSYSSLNSETVKNSFDESALWLGAGYRSPGKISFYTGIMYNVLYDKNDSKLFSSGLQPFAGISVGL